VPWAEVHEHNQNNIVLLCAQHHREKTSGLLPASVVEAANESPLNLRTGTSHPYDLSYSGSHCEATIGSNLHVWPALEDGDFTLPLLVDDTPIVLFRAEDHHLLLTVQLFNDQNELVVQIVDNQLVYSAAPWDVEFVGRQLTVRGGPGDIFVRMTFDPPARVEIDRGHIWRNGIELDITPEHLMLVNNHNSMSRCSTVNCRFGVAIGNIPPGLFGAIAMDAQRDSFPSRAGVENHVVKIMPSQIGHSGMGATEQVEATSRNEARLPHDRDVSGTKPKSRKKRPPKTYGRSKRRRK
jgi:hypothetical protein